MKRILLIFIKLLIVGLLTIITQIGGIAFLISELLSKSINLKNRLKSILSFVFVYGIMTFIIVPMLAPLFGREKIKHSKIIRPTTYLTIVLNRNYVKPELNSLLHRTEDNLKNSDITINYLDANFPFLDNFPLLPHLSHDDGKKLDLSLIYETPQGIITNKQKSVSGYGVFESPKSKEYNQITKCIKQGYLQYDFPKYLTFGKRNKDLKFSEIGTKNLITSILKNSSLGKLLIEPHLKNRLKLKDNRVRYHGCHAVRHDDHIHIQLK